MISFIKCVIIYDESTKNMYHTNHFGEYPVVGNEVSYIDIINFHNFENINRILWSILIVIKKNCFIY